MYVCAWGRGEGGRKRAGRNDRRGGELEGLFVFSFPCQPDILQLHVYHNETHNTR